MTYPKVSVIVPIYKVESYLQECIDSIRAQSFSNIEIILVNDGSPDSCGEICDKNAALDSRIKVIHQENQGVTRARANGVAIAKGDFINFVDGDDSIPTNSIETLYRCIDENTDIVIGKYAGAPCPPQGKIPLNEYREMCSITGKHAVGPVAKLYHHTLFTKNTFDLPKDLKVGEDLVMNIRLAYEAKGDVYSTNAIVYRYRNNEMSIMHTFSLSAESDYLLQKYRLESIPPADIQLYLKKGLADNLITYWINATIKQKKIPHYVREYHNFLLSIKKYSSLQLSWYPNILFHCNNVILRTIIIGLRNILHILKKN